MVQRKEVTETMVRYVCEVCGRARPSRWDAERCERSHRQASCKHESKKDFEVVEECGDVFIQWQCADCEKRVQGFRLSDLDSNNVRAIYELLKERL